MLFVSAVHPQRFLEKTQFLLLDTPRTTFTAFKRVKIPTTFKLLPRVNTSSQIVLKTGERYLISMRASRTVRILKSIGTNL